MADDRKLQSVDLVGVGNLLEQLVLKDSITCDERDAIIQRISRDNDLGDCNLSALAGYGRSKEKVLERAALRKLPAASRTSSKPDVEYVSLTEFVRTHSGCAPGYVIQSWLRSENTLAFLNLWETENNPGYCEDAYVALLKKKKEASFTLTPKLWIDRTKAIGITSKQGKSGGTFAHSVIACEFASWLTPEFKMLMLKLSLFRDQLR